MSRLPFYRIGLGLAQVLLALMLTTTAFAQDINPLIAVSAQHLREGRVDAAITMLESAADEGHLHPELSFNRGVSYLRRVGSASEQRGDLGQAAAAFAEVLAQRPADLEAQRGLEDCQLMVARRNSKGQSEKGAQVSAPLGLLERALLSLAPAVLFWLSAIGSTLLSVGLLLRLLRIETARLAGMIAAGVGLLILTSSSCLFLARAWTFKGAKMAVVVAAEANVVDQTGRKIPGRPALAESTLVYVSDAERGLVRLVGGLSREYMSVGQLRVVSTKSL